MITPIDLVKAADQQLAVAAKARLAQEAIARTEAAPCPTLDRLLALKPGEEFRYCTEDSLSTSGPACKALIARIKDGARGLALKGRVALFTKEYKHKARRWERSVSTVTEYWARGLERSK